MTQPPLSTEDAARRQQALLLFDTWLDLGLPADQQQAWLQRECGGDALLQAQVEALLAADAGAGDPFPADPAGWNQAVLQHSQAPDLDALTGQHIGPWRITGVMGHGGMGAVYAAERADGAYRQDAAVKLIRMGLDIPGARERFLQERQILARLQHPHIARLLDGGVTAEGAPYFAMERVSGQRIDAWCDARRLDVRGRIELLLQVLEAVGYAHRNLVVHRDLKPSNVLVNDDGEVKLLDFGIAKLMDEGGDATRTSDRALTPEYASPEQLHGAAITTSTDLYQLGVLLYVLLAGPHPFGLTTDTPLYRRLAALALEPVPLPRAASDVADAIAEARRATPASLARQLRGDLEAIVGRCLEKDPARRYPSVASLADDLRCWLQGKPVAARVPSAGYRFRRFVRRNRVAVGATAAVFLALAAGLGAALWQTHQARLQAQRADVINAYLAQVFRSIDPQDGIGPTVTVKQLIDQGITRLDQGGLAGQPEAEGRLRLLLGGNYISLGDYEQAVKQLELALTLLPPEQVVDAFQARSDLIELSLDRRDLPAAKIQLDAAEAWLKQVPQALIAAHDPDARLMFLRAKLLHRSDQFPGAEAMARQAWQRVRDRKGEGDAATLDLLTGYVGILRDTGRYDEALAPAQALVAGYRLLKPLNEFRLSNALYSLGAVQENTGQMPLAITSEQEALAIRRRILPANHPSIANTLGSVATTLQKLGRLREALPLHAEAVAILKARPENAKFDLAREYNNWGGTCFRLGDLDCAANNIKEALVLWDQLLPPDHSTVLTARGNLAKLYGRRGQLREGEALLRQVLAGREEAVARDHAAAMVTALSGTRGALGENLLQQGRDAEALALAQLRWRDVVASGGGKAEEMDSISALVLLSLAELANQQPQSALEHAQAALTRVLVISPGSLDEAIARLTVARAQIAQGQSALAVAQARQALALYTGITGPEDRNTALAHGVLGRALLAQGQHAEAQTELDKAIASLQPSYPWMRELAELKRIRRQL